MKYLQAEGFCVNMGGSKEYRDNWETIFMKKATKKETKRDGHFLQMDAPVYLVERKNGVEISKEEIGGEVILKLVLMVLEQQLRLLEWEETAVKKRKAK